MTQNPEHAPTKSQTYEEKAYLRLKNLLNSLRDWRSLNIASETIKQGKGVQHWEQQGSLGDD